MKELFPGVGVSTTTLALSTMLTLEISKNGKCHGFSQQCLTAQVQKKRYKARLNTARFLLRQYKKEKGRGLENFCKGTNAPFKGLTSRLSLQVDPELTRGSPRDSRSRSTAYIKVFKVFMGNVAGKNYP